jgi:hypothetical protein
LLFDDLVVGADQAADLVEIFLGHMPPISLCWVPAPELSIPGGIVP